jgi:hypothetical protein
MSAGLLCVWAAGCGDDEESDAIAPDAVADLSITDSSGSSLTLTWTAPGDDGSEGRAAEYDLRYWRTDIDNSDWANLTQVMNVPDPKSAGQTETFVVTGLEWGTTYSFAIRTRDDADNWSATSNATYGTVYSEIPMQHAIDCDHQTSGDHLRRGFLVTQVPTGRLTEVVIYASSNTAGTYTLLMTCRADSYNGTVIGQSRREITLSGDVDDNQPVRFLFPLPLITADSVLTFAMSYSPTAQGSVYYAKNTCGESCYDECPIAETEGTTPPLDTFRGHGMGVDLYLLGQVR